MVPWTLSPLLHPRRPSLVAVQNFCPAKNIKPEKIWITRDQWPNKGGRFFFSETQRDLRDAIGWMAHHFKESKQQIHIMKIRYFLNHCYLLKFHSSFFKRMHQSKVLTFPPCGWIKSTTCEKKMLHHKWMFNMSIFTIICIHLLLIPFHKKSPVNYMELVQLCQLWCYI